MIRVGLIGCGEHSEIGHAVPLARYKAEHPDHLELTAACDLRKHRAEYFCKKYGFRRFYTDVFAMLSSRLASRRLLLAVVLVHAPLSEFLQQFTGRTPQLTDVGLDWLGVTLGVMLTWKKWRTALY